MPDELKDVMIYRKADEDGGYVLRTSGLDAVQILGMLHWAIGRIERCLDEQETEMRQRKANAVSVDYVAAE